MKLESLTAALNLRKGPSTKTEVIGELRAGDIFEVGGDGEAIWVEGTVLTGVSEGKRGFARRRWLVQHSAATSSRLTGSRRSRPFFAPCPTIRSRASVRKPAPSSRPRD